MPRLRLIFRFPARILLAALSGVLLFAANPPIGWWPLALIALVPLLWCLRRSGPLQGAVLGWVFGFTYFGLLVYWLALFGELAWGVTVLLQAAFLAAFGLLAPFVVRPGRPWVSASGLAALWVAVEFARSSFPLGGFGWGAPGYTQAANALTVRFAVVAGVWGVSFVVVMVNASLAEALERQVGWGRRVALVGVALVALIAPAVVPFFEASGPPVDVAVVQVAVPKTGGSLRDDEIRTVADKVFTAHRSLAGERPPDLVIWPEDSMDYDPTLDARIGAGMRGALAAVGSPVLAGAIMGPVGGTQTNQTLALESDGRIVDTHTKGHLVPFGEYVPWRDRLSFLSVLDQVSRDLQPGTDTEPLRIDGLGVASLICFENAFPSIARHQVAQGADFIVVPANNTSYLTTAASQQHLEISRLRAIENGRWTIHASLAGVSGIIDPSGRVYDRTPMFQTMITRREIPTSRSRTPFSRFGDWFAWASVLWAGALVLSPSRRRAPQRALEPLPERPRILVLLPTYNERPTIEEVVGRLLAIPDGLDVLVIDDGSPDGTADAVEALGEPRVRVLRRPRKSGLASAYLTGFRRAVDEGYDLVVEMDSDLSHDPEELPGLLAAATGNHLTIGSRYVAGGSVTNWGYFRRLLSRAGNRYARLCLGFPLTDSTSGYRVFRRALLEEEVLDKGIHSEGYGFQIELAFRAWRDGWAVGEAPITFKEREHGHSKISRRIVLEALWEVTIWGVRWRAGRARPDQG